MMLLKCPNGVGFSTYAIYVNKGVAYWIDKQMHDTLDAALKDKWIATLGKQSKVSDEFKKLSTK